MYTHYLEHKVFKTASLVADEMHYPAYVIGGFVRDCILNREGKDFDIVVVGDGILYAQNLARALNKTKAITIYKTYGTAQIKYDEIEIEIEDDTPINLNNARNNKDLVNQEPIIKIPYDKNRNNYTYMLGTKTEAYFKCRITLTSLSASFNPTFATKSGNTFCNGADSNPGK